MRMYWSEEQFFGYFGIADVMIRGRFDKLCQYSHVNDRTGYDVDIQTETNFSEYDIFWTQSHALASIIMLPTKKILLMRL